MGSIGLSFGSPTSGTGFNVATTVASIVANMEVTETPYKNQLSTLTAEDTAISNLGSLFSTLSTDVDNFTSPTGVLASMEGSSSNTDVLALTSAGTGAVAGSHSITVQQLAQTSSAYAGAVASADTVSGGLSIQVGTGTAVVVTANAGDTIAQFAADINAAGAGVVASVINGSGGEQLSLTSSTSGAGGNITIGTSTQLTDATTGSAIAFHTGQSGQDAMLTVDNIAATSSSNTVTGVIPGVTFQLLDTSPSVPVQVQIENNVSSVGTSVSTLVTDYNAVVNALKAQDGVNSSGVAQPLYGNPLVATVQSALSGAVTANTGSGTSALNLSTLGISLNQDGTLSLDTNALTAALNANFNGVVGFFQTAGGVGESLSTAVEQAGSVDPTSSLALAASENASQEKDIQATLNTLEANISAQQTSLTAALNAANEALQLIPVQIQEVSELYSAITGYGTSNG